jgi:hypothetical protein
MSSLVASKGKALFASATGHADESFETEFDIEFYDEDDDEGGETKSAGAMLFGADGAMTFGVDVEEEVEAMAVKPFVGAIFPPSSYQPSRSDNDAPSASLQLEYVFGYSKKTRDDVFSLGGGKVFWPSASVGIIHDTTSHASGPSAQSHLIGHRDEITSAAQSPQNPTIIATGSSQLTRKRDYPKTIVWDAASKSPLAQFQSRNCKRQVDALAFDSSGQYVFAAGAGDKHNIVCYSISNGCEISYVSSGSSRVLAMDYDASTNSLGEFIFLILDDILLSLPLTLIIYLYICYFWLK